MKTAPYRCTFPSEEKEETDVTYQEVYAAWKADPEAFWMQAAQSIDWIHPPSKALFD